MKTFEYKITKHPAETLSSLVYFCSEAGECTLEQIPSSQEETLQNILNDEGKKGWELLQLSFGKNGIIGFWKKEVQG